MESAAPQKAWNIIIECVELEHHAQVFHSGLKGIKPKEIKMKEQKIKSKVGLWIDHRKCIMVFIIDKKTEKKIINSNAEKHPGRIDGKRSTRSFESQMVKADDRQERHFTGQLNTYFDKVISYLGDAESILIFGPGEAKGEFLKRINMHKINGHIEELENADKMTDAQIIAKVKQYYFK